MKKCLLILLKIYLAFLLAFVVQKLLFLLINGSYGEGLALADAAGVVWHGLRLDMVSTSYLMIVPMLLVAVAMYAKRANLRRLLTFWYVPASLCVAVAFLADAMLYHYWGAKLDANDFIYAQNPRDMLASLSTGLALLAFGAVALLTALQVWLLRAVTPREMPAVRWKPLGTLAMALLLGVNVLGMRGGVQESTANPSYAYFSQQQFLNHAALNPAFNILHSMAKSEDLAHEFEFYSGEELARRTAPVFQSHADLADTLLNTQRPNVMIVVWEGGGELMTGNAEVAPGFARLKQEGVYFSQCYANNFRTDRGLVSLLNGWPGLPTTSVMKMSGRCRNLPAIAKHLAGVGYGTSFYYGGDIDFTNMRGYLFETGYEKVYGGDHYAWVPNQGKWGADDEYLLSLANSPLPKAPFFATFMTLSSHEPWQVPYHRLGDDKANAFAYTDSCLFAFVEELKGSPLWDSLLLVVVPDHGVAFDTFYTNQVSVAHIPLLWLGGAVRRSRVVDCMMNQSDFAATLLAQMGIGTEDFIFSRNVLSAHYVPTLLTHAYKNGVNLIDTLGSSRFDIVNGEVVSVGTLHRPHADADIKALLQRVYTATADL